MYPLLEIKNLQIEFLQDATPVSAVQNISFTATRGKLTAIVGESGSGKSVTALAVLKLLSKQVTISGDILFSETGKQQVTLNVLSEKEISRIRGNKIAMIFQEPMTSLNPVLTCGAQVMEILMKHRKLSRKEAKQKTIELFEQVELPDAVSMIDRYPHQVSGGQKQRVMIAMAISCNPDLLIADEPTTALDVRVQKNIIRIIRNLQQQNNMSVLFITHDLGLVADIADEIIVMYKGQITEQGNATDILNDPKHYYTKALLACRPVAGSKGKKLKVLNDFLIPGEKEITCQVKKISGEIIIRNTPVLSVRELNVHFPSSKNIFGRTKTFIKAVDQVSFEILQGEIVGLAGESGCGKTTLGRAILQLIKPTSGQIILYGRDITSIPYNKLRQLRKDLQIVFQDPYGSLNPRINIGSAILEALTVHQLYDNNKMRKEAVVQMLEKVQLTPDHFKRYPHQFSGGQRQRVCIARALALNPAFLIFDESVSALDVSVQAGILNLINELKNELNFTSLFISHDLSVVHYISDRILIMNKGKIIESGKAGDVFLNPAMKYTRELIDAIPGKNLA